MTPRLTNPFGRPKAPHPARAPRIFAYCASNIGMGHYCRLTRVLEELRRRRPALDILLVTDAPDLGLARRAGAATLQLPRFRFVDADHFKERPEALSLDPHALRDLRAEVILAAGKAFDPDLVLADTNPHGKRDELLPLLKRLRKAGRARICLMMRDIPCPLDESFKLNGAAAEIERHAVYYDRFLIAGDAKFFDPAEAYGWSEAIRACATMAGFMIPPAPEVSRVEALAPFPQLNPASPLVVAGFGGGWEVESMLSRLLSGLATFRQRTGVAAQLIAAAGPAAAEEALAPLREQAAAIGGVEIGRFFEDFHSLLRHADLAILQAGSTPFQLLDTNVPIVLTVRDYKSREQVERATRLAALPGIRLLDREAQERDDPSEWIAWGIERQDAERRTGFDLCGIARAAEIILKELD